jgi:hypothetical protein
MVILLAVSTADASALQVTNQKTDSHVGVPGTNVYFAPARGLSIASAFGGFESKARRIEVIVANIDAPFSDIASGFTDVSFQTKGMELKSRGDLTINGGRAVLYKALHPDSGINWGKWIMLAENGGRTLVVNAVFISGDADAASDLEIMLKGLYLDDLDVAQPSVVTAEFQDIPRRQIISDELEPLVVREMEIPLSGDLAGSVLIAVSEDANESSAAASGAGSISLSGKSEDVFDREAAIRMLTGGNGVSVSTDVRVDGFENTVSSADLPPPDVASGDAGVSGVDR